MSRSIIGVNHSLAVKRFSAVLMSDIAKIGYFSRKFMGSGNDSSMPIQRLTQLENDAGDKISYDLLLQLRNAPVEGEAKQEGTEEALKFYSDEVKIDLMRSGVNGGSKITRKRTVHDIRKLSRKKLSEWWARAFDELFFMYLSGARGINADFIFPTSYAGFAGNTFTAPDDKHVLYGGTATSKATVAATDKMDTTLIDRAKTRATMLGGGTEGIPALQPIMIDGEERFVILMNPFQEYDLRTATGASNWLEIQKAAAGAEGRNSPIFKGALGMHNGVVLHSHKNVIRFSDYGAGSNIAASRALFLGAQAAVCAFGSPGNGLRFDWHEEMRDNNNELIIATSSIFGIKKTAYTIDGTSRDFGVMSLDTAAKDPN